MMPRRALILLPLASPAVALRLTPVMADLPEGAALVIG